MKEQDRQILIDHRMDQAQASLEEARLLLAQGRTTLGAVNRAYYAMFYAVLALLQDVGKIPRKHSGAIALFDSEFVKKGVFSKGLSSALHTAFESRQASDYHTIAPLSHGEADAILLDASAFVKSVWDYFKKQRSSSCPER